MAYSTIVSFGMSKKNPNFSPISTDGHNIYSEGTAAEIDKEIIELVDKCTKLTREILKKHEDKIKGLAEAVLKK
jgi:ATP-dependent Zn protease